MLSNKTRTCFAQQNKNTQEHLNEQLQLHTQNLKEVLNGGIVATVDTCLPYILKLDKQSLRMRNVMIFGLAELFSDKNSIDLTKETRQHDSATKMKVLKILSNMTGNNYDNLKVLRMGKYAQIPTRPRPVKIILRTEADAQNCL